MVTLPPNTDNKEKPNTSHPLLKNPRQTMDLLKKFQDSQENEEVIIERIEEWRDCVNRLASTDDGKYFLKMLIKAAAIFTPRNTNNTVKMVELAGAANFYLKYIRPYLNPTNRQEIE